MRLILATSLLASLWTAQAFAQADDVWVVPSYKHQTQAVPAPAPAPIVQPVEANPPVGSDSYWVNVGRNIAEADNCRFITNAQMEAALNDVLTQSGYGDTLPPNVQTDISTGSASGKAYAGNPANCAVFTQSVLDAIRAMALAWNGQ